MSEDQFTKLFKYIQEFRKDVDGRFEDLEDKFDKRFNFLTNLAEKVGVDLDKIHA